MTKFGKKVEPRNLGNKQVHADVFLTLQTGDHLDEYQVKEVLTVGRIGCDITLDHESISNRHCNVFNNNGIMSIVDLSSKSGSFISGKRLEPNRQYILSDNDKVTIGGFVLKVHKKPVVVANTDEILEDKIQKKSKNKKNSSTNKQVSKKINIPKKENPSRGDSLNAIFRLVALNLDLLTVLIIVTCLNTYLNFDESFSLITTDINNSIDKLVGFSSIIEAQFKAIPALKRFFTDISSIFPFSFLVISKFFYLFIIFRVLTAFVLGVTFGQFILGVHNIDGGMKGRVKSLLRELIGAITFPFFFITDFLTTFSKRSLKEVITKSKIVRGNIVYTVLSSVFFTLFFVVGYLALPFVFFPNALISKDISQVIASKKNIDRKYREAVSYIDLEFFSENQSIILPSLKVKRFNGKSILYPEVNIYNEKSTFNINKMKSIRTSDLFSTIYKETPFMKVLYPEISSSFDNFKNKNFKMKSLRNNLFSVELIKLFRASFDININKMDSYILENGFFFSPYIKFQNKIKSLIDLPFESIKIYSSTNVLYVFFEKKLRGKSFLNLMTIDQNQTTIYDLNLDGIKLQELVLNMRISKNINSQDNLSLFFDAIKSNDDNLKQLAYQDLYERIYEFSKNSFESEVLKNKLLINSQNLFDYFKNLTIKKDKASVKLIQNLGDLIEALKKEDRSFFQLEQKVM